MKWFTSTCVAVLTATLPLWLSGQSSSQVLSELERDLAALVSEAKPSVVSVSGKVVARYENSREGGFLGLWGQKKERRTVTFHNVGSGLVVDDSGHVVTRSSVVAEAEEIMVRLCDGRAVAAECVGVDHSSGLAVVRIPPRWAKAARLGSTQNLQAGSWVTVIGNPFGMAPSISFGLVDGLRQDGLMRVSGSVAAGSAGSPVFNTRGEVVGIVAAAVDVRASGKALLAAGEVPAYLLAYPIEEVKNVVRRIIELDGVGDGWLGITVISKDSADRPTVASVEPGGPAHQAGLLAGDVLVRFEGQELPSSEFAARTVRATPPGSTVMIEVERNGRLLPLRVTVGQRPAMHRPPSILGAEPFSRPLDAFPTDLARTSPEERRLEETVRLLQRRLVELEREIRALRRSVPRH
ncbi:MAG: S1C family serine protease [candidate division KSB1 bacterium]|nr:S1C family serine protease [candidate division KSB1 bacterium]